MSALICHRGILSHAGFCRRGFVGNSTRWHLYHGRKASWSQNLGDPLTTFMSPRARTEYSVHRPTLHWFTDCDKCIYYLSLVSTCIGISRHGEMSEVFEQESSAKLTNQRVSYAFTSSLFSYHACHILPASKFQYSYSCIILIFYMHQWTACMRTVSVNTVHWFDASSSGNPNE